MRRPPLVFLLLVTTLPMMSVGTRRAHAEIAEVVIPPALSLDQALALFRQHGFDLLIADAQVESAGGDVTAAGAIPNPTASGGFYRSFFNDHAYDSHNGWSVGLADSNAIEDTLSGKRHLRARVAEAALAAARMQRVDAQRTLELQVKQGYFAALVATAALEFARQVAVTADDTFQLNQVRYKSGAISEVDLSKTETAKLEADQAVDSALSTLRQSKVALAFLLGQRHGFSDFAVDREQLRFAVPAGLKDATAERLIDRALQARSDLRALTAQRERAGSGLALARRLRFPDIGVGAEYQRQGSGDTPPGAPQAITPPTLELSLTAALPLLYQQQGEIRKAEADVRTQDLQLAKIKAQVVADVETAFGSYQASRRLVERMEGRLLDRAHRTRDLVELQYKKGAASLLEYLDAQRTYIAINLEYLQDLSGYWGAVFQLEAAVASELTQ
ncbi:MAG TPA: TolC family protein [Polyangia bacterium]|nr:TolC family protein [Polyangia bacterium]